MPVLTPDVALDNQWNYLISLLTSEAVPGKRLAGINYVGKSISLWTPAGTSIGVQLKRAPLSFSSSNKREMNSEFWIITGVQSTPQTVTAPTPPNLDDAMTRLRGFVGTGDGNGLTAIFTDAATYTLGGNALQTFAHPPEYDWRDERGQGGEIWAYALIRVMAKQIVWVPGVS